MIRWRSEREGLIFGSRCKSGIARCTLRDGPMASTEEQQSRYGIRTKFVVAFALLTFVVAVLIVGIEHYRFRRAMADQTSSHGAAIADTVASTAGYYVAVGLTADLKKIVLDPREEPFDRVRRLHHAGGNGAGAERGADAGSDGAAGRTGAGRDDGSDGRR